MAEAYHPSTNWGQGGPIIEREWIWIFPPTEKGEDVFDDWGADIGCYWFNRGQVCGDGNTFGASGPTPLVAAMRAYVMSKLGEEIELEEPASKAACV